MARPGQCTIVFNPSGLAGTVPVGITVLDAARRLGADLDSVCGGRGLCGRCQVEPASGQFAKWAVTSDPELHLSPWGELEAGYRGGRPIGDGCRLGCGATVLGDLVIDVPAASQVHKVVVRKELDLTAITVDPVVTLHYVELPPPEAGDGSGTARAESSVFDRLASRLAAEWGITEATIEPALLARLHPVAAASGLTVAARGRKVVAIWPGLVDRAVGVAIDVGSTTVAGHLCDLATGEMLASAGRMNPQITYGEDLMSRVSYAMLNDGGGAQLTEAIRRALGELVGELVAAAGGLDRSQLLEIVVVGNPVMHHLVLGIDPTPLGQAPFPLATTRPVEVAAAELGIDAPSARVYVGPCIAGHVGADTAAAILAEGPHSGEQIQLLVDVGTNAEIVVGNRHGLFAASSPTGPAFEGAQISAGQRATAGAIERVRIDRHTLEPRFKVIGADAWSDEPAFAAEAGRIGVTGICGSGVVEAIGELFLAGVINHQGVIVPEGAARTPRITADGRTWCYLLTDTIRITQADVRAIQLAKAALRAGIELLLERAGLASVDEVRLAGAFGTHLDPIYAMVLGLVPDCPLDAIRSVGNAAGAGAVRALLSGRQRAEMEAAVRSVTKIETATEPRFQEHFVAALAFPHEHAATPHLAAVIELPAAGTGGRLPGRRRRRDHKRGQS
jgi:uncharacterized 2Fe-2S/4Fe-4S cluster protein (DUF4445 family)